MQDYWLKQAKDKPLYPDLIWSRPENKLQAGKLLIIGGNIHSFAAAAEAYNTALNAGIGTARVILPDVLQKTVGRVIDVGEYVPSTPSGSFARQALGELLASANWADAVLLAGDFGRNSETAILLEQFIDKYHGLLCITKDALDYFTKVPLNLINRESTLIVASFAQLQQIAMNAQATKAFTFNMDLLHLVEQLHEFSSKYPTTIIIKHLENILVALNGQVSTTKIDKELKLWRTTTAAKACVWWLQNPNKAFEALTSSLI